MYGDHCDYDGECFMGGITYVPDLAPVGSKASYWPRSVQDDTTALWFLGFLDNVTTKNSLGSQQADMANQAGAWDPRFRAAVLAYQKTKPGILVADGWIGPATRQALAVDVAIKNAQEAPVPIPPIPPVPVPPVPVPPQPVPVPPVPPQPPGGLVLCPDGKTLGPPCPPAGPIPNLPPVPNPMAAPAAPAKSHTGLYLGIGAGILALGGLAYVALSDD